jgi:putative peptidoglycan lipid II flippase
VVLGAFAYLLVQIPGLLREGMRYSPTLGLHDPAIWRIGRQIVPRLIGQSAVQINIIATTSFAALLASDQIAPLNTAYQLMLLPHGIFVMSLVTVLFPQMAELYAHGEHGTFRETALRALRLVVFVTTPLAVALAVLRVPVIRLLFDRGRVDAQAIALIAAPLLVYLTSVVAFAASEPLVRTFYAMQDTRTPVLVALATIALNIALGYLIVTRTTFGAPGLALAFSIANNFEALALLLLLVRRFGGLGGDPLLRSFAGTAVSSAVLGLALAALYVISRSRLPMITLAGSYGSGADALILLGWLALAGLLALTVYLAIASLLRVPELAEVRALIRSRRSRPAEGA